MREGLKAGTPGPWGQLTAQVVLGSAGFVAQLQDRARGNVEEQGSLRHWIHRPEFSQVIAVGEALKAKAWNEFLNHHGDRGRDLVLYLAAEHCGLTLASLGREAGGMGYKAVCQAIRRFKECVHNDPTVATLAEKATRLLKNPATP
ncbi:MAG: hypothetical protein WBN92_01165 [Terriglobia bacterium]